MSEPNKGPSQPQEHSALFSRRRFLAAAGGAALTLGAAAVGYEVLRDKRTPEQIETDEGIAKLHEYIGELKDSDLKQQLIEKVLPIFSNPKPEFINLEGIQIPLKNRGFSINTVRDDPNIPDQYHGNLMVFKEPSDESGITIENLTVELPIPDFLTSADKDKVDTGKYREDGTYVESVAIPSNYGIDPSISAEIYVTLVDPQDSKLDKKTLRQIEKMIYIKEAMSLLFFLTNYERVVKAMNETGVSPTVSVESANGKLTEISPITTLLTYLAHNQGRYQALGDLGGYYLMFNALDNSDMEGLFRTDTKFSDALDSIEFFKESHQTSDPFHDAIEWALSSPAANKLPHQGDLNKIP